MPTAVKERVALRNGIVEIDLQPGDQVPTERVAKAVLITPQLAEAWLDRYADPDRRHIRPAKVADYASKMLAGDWVEMSKNIEFTNDPIVRLSDGHHRLRAIAQSGVPLWFEVHFGADPRSRRIEGVRLTRSPGDMLRMEGCPGYYSEIAAGIRNVMLYEQTAGTDTRWRVSSINMPDAEDVVLYWLEQPGVWGMVAPFAKTFVTSWPTGMAQGVLTGFTFLAEQVHPGQGTEFLKTVAGGGGPTDGRGKSVLSIMIQLLRIKPVIARDITRSGTQKEWERYTMAVLVRAFNAWVVGKTEFTRPEWGSSRPFPLERIR